MREIFELEKMTVAQKRFKAKELAKLLNDAYLSKRRDPSDRAKKSFAPSNLGYMSGTCPRQWFYSFTGGVIRVDEVDAMGVANMAYGTEAHERIQDLFNRSGVLVEAERKVISEDPPVFGFADVIINWQGEEAVGEIKTTGEASFISKKAKNTPAGYHLLQVLIYMKALELNKGFLLYENKNTQQMHIIPVTWNEANRKLADDTWEWMRSVHGNWQTGAMPKRPFRQSSRVCKQCPFYEMCWNDKREGVVDLPALVVPA